MLMCWFSLCPINSCRANANNCWAKSSRRRSLCHWLKVSILPKAVASHSFRTSSPNTCKFHAPFWWAPIWPMKLPKRNSAKQPSVARTRKSHQFCVTWCKPIISVWLLSMTLMLLRCAVLWRWAEAYMESCWEMIDINLISEFRRTLLRVELVSSMAWVWAITQKPLSFV